MPIKTELCTLLRIDLWEFFGDDLSEEEVQYRVSGLMKALDNGSILPRALGIQDFRYVELVYQRTNEVEAVRKAMDAALEETAADRKAIRKIRAKRAAEVAVANDEDPGQADDPINFDELPDDGPKRALK